MKITDIDKYSPEMQNPDITNRQELEMYRLLTTRFIAALAVKRGELDRKEIGESRQNTDLQDGHRHRTYPIRVPYVGFARGHSGRKDQECNFIGKGSLFLEE